MENSLIETSSRQRTVGGWLIRRIEIMTYLKTLGTLCPTQVAGEAWRKDRGEGKDIERDILSIYRPIKALLLQIL